MQKSHNESAPTSAFAGATACAANNGAAGIKLAPELYIRVLNSMIEGVSIAGKDGMILYTNPAEDRMFGYAPGELIGQHVSVQNAYSMDRNMRLVSR